MMPQPQTLQIPAPPSADPVEAADICDRLDRLLEAYDVYGLPAPEMSRQLVNIKTLLHSESTAPIDSDCKRSKTYLQGLVDGVSLLYGLLLPHMEAAEISMATRLTASDAAHALKNIIR